MSFSVVNLALFETTLAVVVIVVVIVVVVDARNLPLNFWSITTWIFWHLVCVGGLWVVMVVKTHFHVKLNIGYVMLRCR